MELNISDEKLAGVVSTAILGAISEGQRDTLVTDAIKYLLTVDEKSGGYSYPKRTPLQQAFDDALTRTCHTMVSDMLKNDEAIQAEIKSLISDAYKKALENRAALVGTIANSIVRGFQEHL